MELTSAEIVVRLSVSLVGLVLLGLVEVAAPRRHRAVARRGRWTGNVGLAVAGAVFVRVVSPVSAIGVAGLAEGHGWGLLRATGPGPVWLSVAVSVVLLDLALYLQHVLFHALPVLWRLHRVHHSDPDVDVTTGVRFHPVELLVSAGFKAGVVGVLGPPVASVLLFEIVLNAGSLFNHANLRLSERVDRLLRAIVVTPDMHRVHHSADRGERDCNFGFALSWWDGLLGTYRAQPRLGHDGMAIGVAGLGARDVLSLRRLLVQPLRSVPASGAGPDSPHFTSRTGQRQAMPTL